MKMLTILTTLILSMSLDAIESPIIKLGCRVLLEQDDYNRDGNDIYIKSGVMQQILSNLRNIEGIHSYDAWEMLDFHVFIYVECQYCGMAHPIDYQCPNPNCRGHNKMGSVK